MQGCFLLEGEKYRRHIASLETLKEKIVYI